VSRSLQKWRLKKKKSDKRLRRLSVRELKNLKKDSISTLNLRRSEDASLISTLRIVMKFVLIHYRGEKIIAL